MGTDHTCKSYVPDTCKALSHQEVKDRRADGEKDERKAGKMKGRMKGGRRERERWEKAMASL
jgi:hypothetical protein